MLTRLKPYIALCLLALLLMPSVVVLMHHHQQEDECTAQDENHLHKQKEECPVCHFEFSVFAIHELTHVPSVQIRLYHFLLEVYTSYHSSYTKYSFLLRAPPSI